jgi:7,8-dihydropterin-6-yl-methyl-4-(beta-D-ribofuranosyl)aminobenzene 5'-phosphate synthase
MRKNILYGLVFLTAAAAAEGVTQKERNVTVTILTTNAADTVGQGEWSFSAWVEVDGRAFLFDTGWSPRNVLSNAEALGIDLSVAEDLILSHHHGDHTGGLETLRRELVKRNPKALSRIHTAEGIFAPRPTLDGNERNPMVGLRQRLEALGATFLVYDRATELAKGVWVTGPVPRPHDEKVYPVGPQWVMKQGGSTVPDVVPESQSLVVVADGGPVVVSGCGHAGLVNTLEHIQTTISEDSPQAAIGGFHLFAASDDVLSWTAGELEKLGLDYFLGSHCTGFESVYRIRELASLTRERALVGAIGTKFVVGKGIDAGAINR